MADLEYNRFASSYGRTTGIILLWALPVSAGSILLLGGAADPVLMLLSLAFGAAAGLLFNAIVVAYFKVGINPNGLRSYDFWGLYREVQWADMSSAVFINFGGLHYIRVFTVSRGRPLWLPLFLRRQSDFNDEVERLAPATNPLREYLLRQDT